MSTDTPVDWAGRTFGQLTEDEKRRVTRAAASQLAAELQAAAPAITEVLDGTYQGMDLERIYEVADVIEQQVLESKPVGEWWAIGAIMRKGKLDDRHEVIVTLNWMLRERYIISNGRGGCWVNYARKH
jgi:hypothetical protein